MREIKFNIYDKEDDAIYAWWQDKDIEIGSITYSHFRMTMSGAIMGVRHNSIIEDGRDLVVDELSERLVPIMLTGEYFQDEDGKYHPIMDGQINNLNSEADYMCHYHAGAFRWAQISNMSKENDYLPLEYKLTTGYDTNDFRHALTDRELVPDYIDLEEYFQLNGHDPFEHRPKDSSDRAGFFNRSKLEEDNNE